MSKTDNRMYLRPDQWDLIVLVLTHIRKLTETSDGVMVAVDRLGRTFLRRRCIEIVDDIHAKYPQAGE